MDFKIYGTVDKAALVVDIGTRYIKCGFAGEASPRCVFTDDRLATLFRKTQTTFGVTEADWFTATLRLFQAIYFRHLHTKPKDRRVLVCLYHSTIEPLKAAIHRVVLEYFGAPALACASSSGLALYPTGFQTGLVVDVGFYETRAVPVYCGIVLESAVRVCAVGASHVLDALHDSRLGADDMEDSPTHPSFSGLDDASIARLENSLLQASAVLGRLAGDAEAQTFKAYGLDLSREQFTRILQVPFNPEHNLQGTILDAILRCPVDSVATVLQNVVVVGGIPSLPQFHTTLKTSLFELEDRRWNETLRSQLHVTTFRCPSNIVAWVGGSVAASLSSFAQSTTTLAQFQQVSAPVGEQQQADRDAEEESSDVVVKRFETRATGANADVVLTM